MNIEDFKKAIEELGISYTDKQLENLEIYYEMLIDWNEKINLTTIIEKQDVYLKHYYDSMTLFNHLNFNEKTNLCDVGTGAGFPGMMIAIFFDNIDVTLVDSLQKRTKFLEEVKNKLKLKNVTIVHDRAETFALNNKEKYDFVTARAVASLRILVELCTPLLKVGGSFLAMKANISQEIIESESAINKLNCRIEKIDTFNLPNENSIRNIIVIKKVGKTDKDYPRKYDLIKKKPL
jgi:16S rRNA (guanine527-N7)-methyltransferase